MMATSGQTLNDRINAARYALAGQSLARCVCKATTEEVLGPKKKHLDYLLACTHEPNVSIPQMANMLIERTNHIHWVVVFKALVTMHHLMSYGNERFIQYLASSNYSFELSTFLDKTTARDFSMSTFIRRYSRYINEKALSYRLLAFDLCKVKRGNEGTLRIMPIDRLLKTLPILQNQMDALLEFDCTANDLNNGVINACFMLMFRDLIGLFACYNDGIINLLNKYFSLNRKLCREAFELYKKFLVRIDKVSDFLKVAEVVGIDKDDIPDLRRAPSSLVDALEQHLQNIESNKKLQKQSTTTSTSNGSSSTTISSSNNNNNNNNSNNNNNKELNILGNLTPPISRRSNTPNSTSTQLASASATTTTINQLQLKDAADFSVQSFKDDEVRKALEEEARVLSQYGTDTTTTTTTTKHKSSLLETQPKTIATNPKSIDDIFGDSDLFANNGTLDTTTTTPTTATISPLDQPSKGLFALDNFSTTSNTLSTTSSANYTNLGGLEGFGDLLQPTSTSNIKNPNPTLFANNKPPLSSGPTINSTTTTTSATTNTNLPSTGLFKGDLDSTLANLVQNLTFDGISKTKK